jgi:hypothetical protein
MVGAPKSHPRSPTETEAVAGGTELVPNLLFRLSPSAMEPRRLRLKPHRGLVAPRAADRYDARDQRPRRTTFAAVSFAAKGAARILGEARVHRSGGHWLMDTTPRSARRWVRSSVG